MKARSLILIAVSVLLIGAAVFAYLAHRTIQSRIGPERSFEIKDSPMFLTETLALEKARQTLELDGLSSSIWQPRPDGRTKSPDGRLDEFMARNANSPNRATILFTNGTGAGRFVSVELIGGKLVCQTSMSK